MHHFYYFAIFPVTVLAVAGYVTLYCAKNSEGRMRTAGKILAGWSFLLAIAVVAMMIIFIRQSATMGRAISAA